LWDALRRRLLGQTDGVLDCLGLATAVGDDYVAVYAEQACSAIFPVVDSFGQSQVLKQSPPLKAVGIGKDMSYLAQRVDKGVAHAFNGLEDDVAGETIGHDDIRFPGGYILAFYIANEVEAGHLQELVGLFNQLAAFRLLFTVAQQADARCADADYPLAVNSAQTGELDQVGGATFGIGAGVNEEYRLGGGYAQQAAYRRAVDAFYLTKGE
jgi:hypothetical protein